MMGKAAAWARPGWVLVLALAAIGVDAQPFVPPAGFLGKPGPGVATPPEPGSPPLSRIPDASIADRFRVDPDYPRHGDAAAKVIGAFDIAEPPGTHLVSAWGRGFLPVTLSFSDGRCFSLTADYAGGTLSNGRLTRVSCGPKPNLYEPQLAPPPPDRGLRPVGSSWGYGAWSDDRTGTTIITAPFAKTFQPLFTARMGVTAIAGMNGPDWPGGNMTIVGRIDGRLVVVTLEVGY
jgi:hypothetical protein